MFPTQVAAFFSNGPGKTIGQVLLVLVGIKFFVQIVGPDQRAYRTFRGLPIVTRRVWRYTVYGLVCYPVHPTVRSTGRGIYLKVPILFDFDVETVSHETREHEGVLVDCRPTGKQYRAKIAATYHIDHDGASLYRARRNSATLDSTIMVQLGEACRLVLEAHRPGSLTPEEITILVRLRCARIIRFYGIKLVRITIREFALNWPEKLPGHAPSSLPNSVFAGFGEGQTDLDDELDRMSVA